MGDLAPDFLLELPGRAVWIDAKYKNHLRRLAVALRESHRADLHQALAYAMLAETPRVDTFLVYPGTVGPAGEPMAPEPVFALADLVTGGRQVRLGLGSIPFGFRGPAHREQVVAAWEKVLRDAA